MGARVEQQAHQVREITAAQELDHLAAAVEEQEQLALMQYFQLAKVQAVMDLPHILHGVQLLVLVKIFQVLIGTLAVALMLLQAMAAVQRLAQMPQLTQAVVAVEIIL